MASEWSSNDLKKVMLIGLLASSPGIAPVEITIVSIAF